MEGTNHIFSPLIALRIPFTPKKIANIPKITNPKVEIKAIEPHWAKEIDFVHVLTPNAISESKKIHIAERIPKISAYIDEFFSLIFIIRILFIKYIKFSKKY